MKNIGEMKHTGLHHHDKLHNMKNAHVALPWDIKIFFEKKIISREVKNYLYRCNDNTE